MMATIPQHNQRRATTQPAKDKDQQQSAKEKLHRK